MGPGRVPRVFFRADDQLHAARVSEDGSTYEATWVALVRDREELYRRVNERVDGMMAAGLEAEVCDLRRLTEYLDRLHPSPNQPRQPAADPLACGHPTDQPC